MTGGNIWKNKKKPVHYYSRVRPRFPIEAHFVKTQFVRIITICVCLKKVEDRWKILEKMRLKGNR